MGLANRSKNVGMPLRRYLLPVGIAATAIALQAGGQTVVDALSYGREEVAAGEAWRLVTGHLVHLGWSHLALNLAGLFLVWYLVGEAFRLPRWLAVVGCSVLAMDLGFWLLNPDLDWYVGLSGLLHGLLAAGLLQGLRRRDKEAMVLAIFVIGKLAWEQWQGPLPGSEASSGGTVIVDAHLYGAIGGVLGAILTGFFAAPE